MFTNIKKKNKILKELEDKNDESVVIHFNCHICDDEQVTYEEEASFQLEQFKKYGYIVLHYNCTNCGCHIGILEPEYIQGIETLS